LYFSLGFVNTIFIYSSAIKAFYDQVKSPVSACHSVAFWMALCGASAW